MIWSMIPEGLFPEAAKLLKDSRSGIEEKNNSYALNLFNQLQAELDFAQGAREPNNLIYALEPTPGPAGGGGASQDLLWQMGVFDLKPAPDPEHDGERRSQLYTASVWHEHLPARPTMARIEVEVGPDEGNLTPLASQANAPTQGRLTLHLPAGTRVVRARVVATGTAPATGAAIAAEVTPGADEIPVWYVGAGPNLLPNPDFIVGVEARSSDPVPGWQGVRGSDLAEEKGGPAGQGTYRSARPSGISGIRGPNMTSDRVAIQPAAEYLLSGWRKAGCNFRLVWFDSAGSELDEGFGEMGSFQNWKPFQVRLLRQKAEQGNNTLFIPEKAASLQLVLDGNPVRVTGLSLQLLPAAGPRWASRP